MSRTATRRLPAAAATLLWLLVLAPSVPSARPVPNATPFAGVPAPSSAGAGDLAPERLEPVTFANRTGREIVHLFASPRGARYWGADALGGRRRLPTGAEVDFYLHVDGLSSYDILAVDHVGDAYLLWDHRIPDDAAARVEIGATHLEGGYDHPPLATVEVVNRSGRDIWYLFLAARDSTLAGIDVLGADAILETRETVSIVVPVTGETVGYELVGLDAHDGRYAGIVEITPSTRKRTVEVGAAVFR